MATTANKIIGKVKGIPAPIIAMQKAAKMQHSKTPINTMSEIVKVKIPGASSKRSKKNKISKISINNQTFMHGPGHKKPAHSAVADALFANDDNTHAPTDGHPANDNNFVIVPKNPEIGRNANNIMSHSMNASVGLDKNWTVLFAHDVVIPVGNPMAPVLALSQDVSKPIVSGAAPTGPVARLGTEVFNSPSEAAPLNIQELVRLKAEELMKTNNFKLEDLFMDRP
jgi:hypothetical protein